MVMRACGSGLGSPDLGSGVADGGFCATTGRTRTSDAAREADNKRIRVTVIICLNTILYGGRAKVKRLSQRKLDAWSAGTAARQGTPRTALRSLWHGSFRGSLIDGPVKLL